MININGLSNDVFGVYLNGKLLDVKGIKLNGEIVFTFNGDSNILPWSSFNIKSWQPLLYNNVANSYYFWNTLNYSGYVLEHLMTVCLGNQDVFEINAYQSPEIINDEVKEVTKIQITIRETLSTPYSEEGSVQALCTEDIVQTFNNILSENYNGRFSELRHYIAKRENSDGYGTEYAIDELDSSTISITLNYLDNIEDYVLNSPFVQLMRQIPIFSCNEDNPCYAGFGPYRIDDSYPDSGYRLVKNEDVEYWDVEFLPAYIEYLTIDNFDNPSVTIDGSNYSLDSIAEYFPVMIGPQYNSITGMATMYHESATRGDGVEMVIYSRSGSEYKEVLKSIVSLSQFSPSEAANMLSSELGSGFSVYIYFQSPWPGLQSEFGSIYSKDAICEMFEQAEWSVSSEGLYSEAWINYYQRYNDWADYYDYVIFFRDCKLDREYFSSFLSDSNPYGYSPDLNSDLSKSIQEYLNSETNAYDARNLYKRIVNEIGCSYLFGNLLGIFIPNSNSYNGLIELNEDFGFVGGNESDWYMNTTRGSISDHITVAGDTLYIVGNL